MGFARFGRFAPLLVVMSVSGDARADVPFGANDVATVFFISKSDDHNRVDYGIRLNDHCAPTGDDAVFPYWRELEKNPVNLHSLNIFEYVLYGFSEQRLVHRMMTGGDQLVRLKQLDRPILVTTKKEADGHCSAQARARVGGVEGAIFTSVYAKLAGPMSVDYVDIHGKNPQTGADIVERAHK
jgi:hypothetical protein